MCKANANKRTLKDMLPGSGVDGKHDAKDAKTKMKRGVDEVKGRARDAMERMSRIRQRESFALSFVGGYSKK